MKRRNKFFINAISLALILGIIFGVCINEYKEKSIGEKSAQEKDTEVKKTQNLDLKQISTKNIVKENIITEVNYPKEEVLEEYKGYEVCAKLEIPIIDLETYVLKNYSPQSLNTSVTKFFGPNPNEQGNFCIAGHNFINKNMFRNLKKLKIGDEFFLIDNNIGKVQYKIYDINQVFPNDVSCLKQNTNFKEVTLITCTSDSKKRIIVKAKETYKNR